MLREILRTHFQDSFREQCGILVGSKFGGPFSVSRILLVPNMAEEDDDYVIVKKDYDEVKKSLVAGELIRGFVHTHLRHHSGPFPSDEDIDGCSVFPQYKNIVYMPTTEQAVWYGVDSENNAWMERVI